MFHPSISWISKAGVHLDYMPEDTTRSILFTPIQPHETSTTGKSTSADYPRELPDGCVRGEKYEAGIQSQERNSGNSSKHNELASAKDSAGEDRSIRKPAPFLRRRQGMAAWCSKIRRQGMPVRDPSEELRKKQAVVTTPIQSTIRVPDGSSVSIPMPTHTPVTSALDLPPSQATIPPKKPFSGLFRGCMERASNQAATQEPSGDVERLRGEITHPKLSTDSHVYSSHEEVQTDTGDLEEFELLEEIAENSSFSSLTTSFVSKLGKSGLQDRLKKAEERLQRLNLVDGTGHAEAEHSAFRNHSAERRMTYSNSASNMSGLSNEGAHDGRLSSMNKTNKAVTRAASLSRVSGGILAGDGGIKRKKVARFHLAPSPTSGLKEGPSPDATLPEPHPVPCTSQPLSQSVSKNPEPNTHESIDFDDNHSWTVSATEVTDTQNPQKDPQANLSTASTAGLHHELPTPTNHQSVDAIPRGDSETNATIMHPRSSSPRRSSYNPLDLNSHVDSESQFRSHNDVSTHESKLADQFMFTLTREPSTFAHTNPESQALLRQWINRLEQEVKRFKVENNNLLRMKTEREEGLKRLEAETKRFEEYKAKEQKLFNEYKENEVRKLKKERRVLDEYQRALKSMPSKKDRDELERVREELQEARSDLSRREVRWHAAITRLRTRIEELESERNELKGRIHRLEADRISLQAQLQNARGAHSKSNTVRRSSSLVGSTRQTLNSISQALTFKTAKGAQDNPKNKHAGDGDRRSQQQRQYLSSCRLSSRASSRSGGLESLTDIGARRDSSLTASGPSSVDRHPIDRNGSIDALHRPRSIASVEGARESVNSGGYFTGDDECQSAGSERAMSEVKPRDSDAEAPHMTQISTDPIRQDLTETMVIGEVAKKPSTETLPIPGTAASGHVVHSLEHGDGSTEKTYSNGAVILKYTNGSVKEIFPDQKTVIVSLFNGDVKRTLPDGRVIYHYAADGTVQITHPDGREEINYADGRQEVIYPNSTQATSTGTESVRLPCAEIVSRRLPNGDREIRLPNGQREIHSISGIKCRIYPDGTTKTVFPDGRHETRYASGRLRIKDADGNLVLDTRLPLPDRLSHHPVQTPPSPLNNFSTVPNA